MDGLTPSFLFERVDMTKKIIENLHQSNELVKFLKSNFGADLLLLAFQSKM